MDTEKDILEVMKRLYYRGLNVSQSGNASIRLAGGKIAITPSYIDKPSLGVSGISYINSKGELLKGPKQSTEYLMHIEIYEKLEGTTAVVHAHAPYLLALTESFGAKALRLDEDQEGSGYVKAIGVVNEVTGTRKLADSLAKELIEKHASTVVMIGHGVTSVAFRGESIYDALNRVEVAEHLAMRRALAYMLGK